jgi:hypothetical protein
VLVIGSPIYALARWSNRYLERAQRGAPPARTPHDGE